MNDTTSTETNRSPRPPERALEEVLEALWTEDERGATRREDLARVVDVRLTEALIEGLKSRALIEEREDGSLVFTDAGRERARAIIRRHRLAERLVNDILGMPMPEVEINACEFEHLVAPGITESICTLLGHPRQCPHGRPSPEDRCCQDARRSIEAVVVSANQMHTGETARVAYVNTKNYSRLHKLSSFGITPGVKVKLHQRSPAFVLECDETQLAIEEALAEDIYVLREGRRGLDSDDTE
ncbi:MAG: iron dependent repressor, metal binding and dimerization domain protein [Vicinamibacteria bacterium]